MGMLGRPVISKRISQTMSAKVALLMTGNEIMSGDTVDSNSAELAQALGARGITVREKVTVGDDRSLLLAALERLSGENDLLIVNGGLGPTSDDLTAEIIAELSQQPLTESADAKQHVEQWCQRRGIQPNSANLKQAWLPQRCELVANPIGSAVGFALAVGRCLIITTPGVPSEMRAMIPEVVERSIGHIGGSECQRIRLQTFGMGESTVQQLIHEHCPDWPAEVTLGFRAGMPQLELKLTIDDPAHRPQQQQCLAQLQRLLGDHIIGSDDATLAAALQRALRDQGLRVTAAESCTGGLIASMITREAGASAVFEAGYVTYSNGAKHDLLGVSEQSLEREGAVSESVVLQMLSGALSTSGADVGVSVSGIAGPEGGSDDKPVGTVWLAWGSATQQHTRRLVIPGKRAVFQSLVAALAIDLLRRFVLALPAEPHYIKRQSL